MFNGFFAIQIMNETGFFFTRSCRSLNKGHGVQRRIIPIIRRITSLKKERSIEPISRKKLWENSMKKCCRPIHKHENGTIKKGGRDTKWYWMYIPMLLLREFFSYQKI